MPLLVLVNERDAIATLTTNMLKLRVRTLMAASTIP